jgi:hypothetical protein
MSWREEREDSVEHGRDHDAADKVSTQGEVPHIYYYMVSFQKDFFHARLGVLWCEAFVFQAVRCLQTV